MLIKKLKRLLNRMPKLVEFLKSLAIVRLATSFERRSAFRRLNGGSDLRAKTVIVARHGRSVVGGPFRGLQLGDFSIGSCYVAKLIGCYEEELHPVIEAIAAKKPAVVLDIGCAEGYYAAGFAKLLPSAQVHAFDLNPYARGYCRELAARNDLQHQIHVHGLFEGQFLEQLKPQSTFIFCDCEGAEAELFDAASVEKWRHCDFLIEFHDFIVPGIAQTLQRRFAPTHSVQIIDSRPRNASDYSCLENVAVADRDNALREYRRFPAQWGYFQALT